MKATKSSKIQDLRCRRSGLRQFWALPDQIQCNQLEDTDTKIRQQANPVNQTPMPASSRDP